MAEKLTPPLTDLIASLERASGPDRELDVRIMAATDAGAWSAYDIEYACGDPDRTVNPPAYTASLDAALALVEAVEGSSPTDTLYDALDWLTSNWSAQGKAPDGPLAPILARAVCATLLRSLEAAA